MAAYAYPTPATCPSRGTARTGRCSLPDRTWADRQLDRAPRLVQRGPPRRQPGPDRPDGPGPEARFFETLIGMGFKEIEVGFPAASQPDFDFIRQIIEEDRIPDDVVIQVLVQCRPELIERTFEAIAGARQAIVHFYNSTSTLQRRVVFGLDRDGITDIATDAARLVRSSRRRCPKRWSPTSTPPRASPAPSPTLRSRSAPRSWTSSNRPPIAR